MMDYLIVSRGDEIHRLTFKFEGDGCLYLTTYKKVFDAVFGWESQRVLSWLEARGFEHYWEKDHD